MFDATDFKWNKEEKEKIGITTHHVTIQTEKLKELIQEHYKWNQYTLKGKIDIVTSLAYFNNDKEILEFLMFMEG